MHEHIGSHTEDYDGGRLLAGLQARLPSPIREDMLAVWKFGLGLTAPEHVEWEASVPKISCGTLAARIQPEEGAPALEIGALAAGEMTDAVPVPLAFNRGVALSRNEVRNYAIHRQVCAETGRESVLDRPMTLADYVQGKLDRHGVQGEVLSRIPVFDVIAVLPAPQHRTDYEVNIVPSMQTDCTWAHYLVIQDKALELGAVSDASASRQITDQAEGGSYPYISATYAAELSDVERFMMPGSNAGHIVIVSFPFKGYYGGFDWSAFMDRRTSPDFFGYRSVAHIGDMALGTGQDSGIRPTRVELDYDDTRCPAVYHIVCLGLKRGAENITHELIGQAFQKMN